MSDISVSQIPRLPAQPLQRGWRRCCPNCGGGPILKDYKDLRSQCPVCRVPLSQPQSDKTLAYATLTLVALIKLPVLFAIFTALRPDALTLLTIFAVGGVGLSLYLFPRLKSVMVAIHWVRDDMGTRHRCH